MNTQALAVGDILFPHACAEAGFHSLVKNKHKHLIANCLLITKAVHIFISINLGCPNGSFISLVDTRSHNLLPD
jgi:hypothetical protein